MGVCLEKGLFISDILYGLSLSLFIHTHDKLININLKAYNWCDCIKWKEKKMNEGHKG